MAKRIYHTSGHDPLNTHHLIISICVQAKMIRKNREGATKKLDAADAALLQEALAEIRAALKPEERDARDRFNT
jgi:hypothetical protein